VATTSATVTNVQLFGFTDSSYSQAVSGQGTGGQIGNTAGTIPNNVNFAIQPGTNAVQVPAGSTYYFELRGSVAGVQSGSSVVATLVGDSAYLTNLTSGFQVATSTAASSTSNFVWAGNSTTTSTIGAGDVDFSNGFSLPGLPSSGLIQTRSN